MAGAVSEKYLWATRVSQRSSLSVQTTVITQLTVSVSARGTIICHISLKSKTEEEVNAIKWSLGCKIVWELMGHIKGRDSMQRVGEVVSHRGPACLDWGRGIWQKTPSFLGLQTTQPMPMAKVGSLPCPCRGPLPKSNGMGKKPLIFSSSSDEQFSRHCSKLQFTTP